MTCWQYCGLSFVWPLVLHHQLVALRNEGGSRLSEGVWQASIVYSQLAQIRNPLLVALGELLELIEDIAQLGEYVEGVLSLSLPTQRAWAAFCKVALADDGKAHAIWQMSVIEYVVVCVFGFFVTDCNGAIGVGCFGSWMNDHGCAVLVSFLSDVRHEVDDIGFLEMHCGCSFKPTRLLVSYSRSL